MSLENHQVQRTLHRVAERELSKIDGQTRLYNPAVAPRPSFQEPATPAPSLFNFDAVDTNADDKAEASLARPSVASCAAHLELLAVFAKLKLDVLSSRAIDHAMGYSSRTQPSYDTMRRWQDGKWTKFVDFAAVRFVAWQAHINSKPSKLDGPTQYVLPPLDVLMVWHTFMLNPELFKKYNGKRNLGCYEISWRHVHECIDSNVWTYKPASYLDDQFVEELGLPADLFKQFISWKGEKDGPADEQYFIGLDRFKIGSTALTRSEIDDLSEHGRLLKRYIQLFRHKEAAQLASQLSKAVLRQHVFVEKMNHRSWIRSPAVDGTLRRAKDRYNKFCYLMRTYPQTTMVPTLDIDLVWHTHQCSPRAYELDMVSRTGRFINHDDTISRGNLDEGFERTRMLFWKHFSREYDVCSCWDCEMMLSEVEKILDDPDAADKMDQVAKHAAQRVEQYRRMESIKRKENSEKAQKLRAL